MNHPMPPPPPSSRTTNAYFLQSAVAFGASFAGLGIGVAYLPVDPWTRAFLAMGTLFVITSSFTLAKCVRDRQEEAALRRQWGG
ncbi:YiaA/YiaB family inner membrane protein [Actinorugispora endophytica]|nr:YiaA/YiaB family inner membrane protein [Actinorugispora endophytica]